MLNFTEPPKADFEIVLQHRDKQGNPTGKLACFSSDNSNEIADFYERHEALMKAIQNKGKGKRRNKKEKPNKKKR